MPKLKIHASSWVGKLYVSEGFNPQNPRFLNSSWDTNTLDIVAKKTRISWMQSEVIIGKNQTRYKSDEIIALQRRVLKVISIFTSYKSINIDPRKTSYNRYLYWLY